MWGNYDTVDTANLLVAFDRCNSTTSDVECKSEEQITEWLTGKYFLAYWNYKQFAQDKFEQERVLSKSQTFWFPINPKSRTEYVTHIVRSSMELNDH